MAQLARSTEPVEVPVPSVALPGAAPVVAVGDTPVEWSASPARALHEQLLQSFSPPTPAAVDDRFPLGVRLLIIGAAVLAPWLAIGAAWAVLA